MLSLRYKILREYLDIVYQSYPSDDVIEDLKEQDAIAYQNIRDAQSEYARLEVLFSAQEKQNEETDFDAMLTSAFPQQPMQTRKQDLKKGSIFTPLEPIVNLGYNAPHKGINWPHYENMLKLIAIDYFVQGAPSSQQEEDKKNLQNAVEDFVNLKYKKKHLTAQEILERDTGVYMHFGKSVLFALAVSDAQVSKYFLDELNAEISETSNEHNANQLRKMMHKAKFVFSTLQQRYRSR